MLDYMHIGGSRTGSVWLYETIKQHPEIVSPSGEKQTFFWNQKYAVSAGKTCKYTLETYKQLYQQQDGKVLVDFTDGNSWIPEEDISLLYKTYPNVRITYCIRNPITTLWSHVVKTNVVSSTKSTQIILDRMFDRSIKSNADRYKNFKFFPNVQFKENYQRWCSIFPKEQIMLFLHREIRETPLELLHKISKHISIDPSFWTQSHIKHKTNSGKPIPLSREIVEQLSPIVQPQIDYFSNFFNTDLSMWLNGEE